MARAYVIGGKEVAEAFKKIADEPGKQAMIAVMKTAAQVVQDIIKSKTPVGKTGNLRRAVVIKSNKRYWFDMHSPEYIVAMDYGIAPHAHLVEYGHRIIRGGKQYANRFGNVGMGDVLGQVKGVRYFRRGISSGRSIAQKIIIEGAEKIIEDKWRRLG